MPVILTENAAAEVKKIIEEQGLSAEKTRLRVGVKGGGCSGFSYMLDLTEEEPSEMDEQFEQHGVRIVCDPKSSIYLDGEKGQTTIDFRDEMMQRGFTFHNPNSTSTCGCGSSFNV
jgi:iron-sulfur cluster assembly protein